MLRCVRNKDRDTLTARGNEIVRVHYRMDGFI